MDFGDCGFPAARQNPFGGRRAMLKRFMKRKRKAFGAMVAANTVSYA